MDVFALICVLFGEEGILGCCLSEGGNDIEY